MSVLDNSFPTEDFSFTITSRLADTASPSAERVEANGGQFRGRTGVITTPHGQIQTPAFTPVGTKATVKAVLPESMKELGAQALLSNAYHLYLQPGPEILDAAGGLGAFMNWDGPTFTDSGGFQVMSLGSGFKKVIDMGTVADAKGADGRPLGDDDVAKGKERLAHIDDDGVNFKSHIDGSIHRFTPEVSMQVQHQIGADVMFAFDELTTLYNSRGYQEEALERTRLWALRCIAEHQRLTTERVGKPYQALFGVIQGAQYEDLRRKACQDLGSMPFDGFGIGGALEKENLGTIVRWCAEELPESKPRHLLGISEPDDIFVGIENGVDTFDCVSPPAWHATPPSIPPPAATTSPTRASRRTSRPSTRAAIATPAPTTPAPTYVTSSRRTSVWRRPSPPSTMSVSSCAWWTTPAKPSRTAPTSSTVTSSSATTTPARSPKPALQPV